MPVARAIHKVSNVLDRGCSGVLIAALAAMVLLTGAQIGISTHTRAKKPEKRKKAPPLTGILPQTTAALAFKMCEKLPLLTVLSKK